MVKYRRYQVPGGTYFFTVALQDRKSKYLTQHIRELGEAILISVYLYACRVIASMIVRLRISQLLM
jgi:putative transposase